MTVVLRRSLNPNVLWCRFFFLFIIILRQGCLNSQFCLRKMFFFKGLSLDEWLGFQCFLSLILYLIICLNCLFVEVDVLGPFSFILSWWTILHTPVSIVPFFFNKSSITILLPVHKASLIDIVFGFISRFFVIIDSFLKPADITDLLMFEENLSLPMRHIILDFSFEVIFICFYTTINQTPILPKALIHCTFGVILESSLAVGSSTFERSFIPTCLVKQYAFGLWIYPISILQFALKINIFCEDGRQFLGQIVDVEAVFVQAPSLSTFFLVFLEHVFTNCINCMFQGGRNGEENNVEWDFKLIKIDTFSFVFFSYDLHCPEIQFRDPRFRAHFYLFEDLLLLLSKIQLQCDLSIGLSI